MALLGSLAQVSHRAAKRQLGLHTSQGSTGGRHASRVTGVAVDKPQFLAGCCLETAAHCHMGYYQHPAFPRGCSLLSPKQRLRVRDSNMEATVFL